MKPEDKVLIIGAGTGLDLLFLTAQKSITAIDITTSMVEQLQQKARQLQMEVEAKVMGGHKLILKALY